MAKKKSTCNLMLIAVVILVAALVLSTIIPNKNEHFSNVRENFESKRNAGSCGTCRVRNQG